VNLSELVDSHIYTFIDIPLIIHQRHLPLGPISVFTSGTRFKNSIIVSTRANTRNTATMATPADLQALLAALTAANNANTAQTQAATAALTAAAAALHSRCFPGLQQ
jgi:hypothetical protein